MQNKNEGPIHLAFLDDLAFHESVQRRSPSFWRNDILAPVEGNISSKGRLFGKPEKTNGAKSDQWMQDRHQDALKLVALNHFSDKYEK